MIITFYSYKGGVGRTQLTANLAAYLCYYRDKKILIIDWDMEAPGIDFFFKYDRQNIKKGLIELFSAYSKIVRNKGKIEEDELPLILDKENSYIHSLVVSKKGKIDFIPAGNYSANYIEKVNGFDWYNFYEAQNGKYYIERIKEELNNSEYDYVFIDSRTGTNDYSGICNIQMPEMNVIVVAPTEQNFSGSKQIIQSIKNSPYVSNGLRKSIILPVLSRLDRTEKISGEWFAKFRNIFKEDIIHFLTYYYIKLPKKKNELDELVNEYIENTLLEYKTEISYGEKLMFSKQKKKIEYITLEKQIVEIAERIEKFHRKNRLFIKSNLKKLITEDKFENVFDMLKDLVQYTEYENDIILLTSRYKRLEEKELDGVLPVKESQIEKSKIKSSLLYIMDKIESTTNVLEEGKDQLVTNLRVEELTKQIKLSRELLNEYESSAKLSSDPNERMRSEIEIDRLKKMIDINRQELEELNK